MCARPSYRGICSSLILELDLLLERIPPRGFWVVRPKWRWPPLSARARMAAMSAPETPQSAAGPQDSPQAAEDAKKDPTEALPDSEFIHDDETKVGYGLKLPYSSDSVQDDFGLEGDR